MDYKKLYEKAVERAKTLTNSGFNDFDFVKHIFPELAESEDEKMRKGIIRNLEYLMNRAEGFVKDELKERIAWLEKQSEQKPAWSKEDEYYFGIIQYILNNECVGKADRENATTWFKFLKERVQPQNSSVTDEELAQAKKEAYNEALDKIEYNSGEPTFDDGWSAAIWYLKKRNGKPQNRWKPSDEQMGVIEAVINNRSFQRRHLDSLYDQLKILKGE